MKKINLYWFRFKLNHGNFGDELAPFIISRLSNCDINNILIPSTGFDYIHRALNRIFNRHPSIKQIPRLISQYFRRNFIASIGSIIRQINCINCKVWGSGIIKRDDQIKPALFYAVRGKYTQKRLRELNLPVPNVIGDPALLLPIVYPVQKKVKYKLGIIPHYKHYKDIVSEFKSEEILIIDLTNPIEQILEEINSCQNTISTSLHGIIVSQVYGIPSLWCTYKNIQLGGDTIKFYDYFSSVGIEEYKPFKLIAESFNISDVILNMEKNQNISLIKEDLHKIQKDLIDAAPFSVLDKYKLKTFTNACSTSLL